MGRSVAALILVLLGLVGHHGDGRDKLVTLPFQMMVSLHFVRRHVAFRWSELGTAVAKSAGW